MLKDLQRNNEFWNMTLSAPRDFMKWVKTETSDNAMKLLLVIQKERPEMLETVTREFWKRIWTNGKRIFDREDFEEVLTASGITNGSEYIDQIDSEYATTKLKENSDAAL
ncbi:hypothetical protein OSTOST_19479, partial [Ostertagia ostertagi]